MTDDLFLIADELRALANLGLHYGEDVYNRDRYKRVLELSTRLVALRENREPADVLAQYADNLGHFSPLVGVDAALMRDDKLLLIRRSDNGLWGMPGGLCEVGETLAQAAERELFEETGLSGQALKLLGVFDSRLIGSATRMQLYHAVIAVESEGAWCPAGAPRPARSRTWAGSAGASCHPYTMDTPSWCQRCSSCWPASAKCLIWT